ncbi:hypothetical protein BG004_002748, partial [Podila humilis]
MSKLPSSETQFLEPIDGSPAMAVLEEIEDTLSDSEDVSDHHHHHHHHHSSSSSSRKIEAILLTPSKAAAVAAAAASAGLDSATPNAKVKRLALISSEELRTPTIAIPTVAVAAGSVLVWASILYAGAHKRWVSPVLTFPFMTAACFASFTPVHDGTHSSIAKGPYKKWGNYLVAQVSGIPLLLPFGVYRQLHLLHHRYTNTDKDPDVWDARGPMVFRFFKWFFPDYFWIKTVLSGEVKNPRILEASLFYLAMIALTKKFHNRGMAYVKYWLIPQRF